MDGNRPAHRMASCRQLAPPATVSIVVPCYNEAERLNFAEFARFLREHDRFRFVFVDDGSRDNTGELLDQFAARCTGRVTAVRLSTNVGKGEAVRRGLQYALSDESEIVGFLDADLATPLAELHGLARTLDERANVAVVMGARVKLLGRPIQRQPLRHYCGRVAATLISRLLKLPVYDTQCGAKLFRADDRARRVFAQPFHVRWLFDVEILIRYLLELAPADGVVNPHRYLIEYPLDSWRDVAGSKVKATDFLKALRELMRLYRLYARQLATVRIVESWPDNAISPSEQPLAQRAA